MVLTCQYTVMHINSNKLVVVFFTNNYLNGHYLMSQCNTIGVVDANDWCITKSCICKKISIDHAAIFFSETISIYYQTHTHIYRYVPYVDNGLKLYPYSTYIELKPPYNKQNL